MAQEENVFGCSYSSGGGGGGAGRGGGTNGGAASAGGGSCRSKKIKPKKVPQRGLGVAQLEKIRLEEEQKQDSLAKNGSSSSSPSAADATSFLGVQKFRPNNNVIPHFHNSPPPPSSSSSSNLPSPNALYRHSQSVPNIEILQENCSLSKSGGEIGRRPISTPVLWGADYNQHHHHNHNHAFAFDLPPPPPPPPPHHFQPPPSSMVQVNSSSGISPSSVLTTHLEPPSNQSSRRNISASHFIEEDKMVGMKRPYPFSLESSSPPSLHCNFRPSYVPSSSRPDVLGLCSGGYTPIAESRNKCIRGSPPLEFKPNEVKDDEKLNGEFLTLAPPSVASPSSSFEQSHSSQEYRRNQVQQPESSGSVKESFNFFPVKSSTNHRSNGEEGDKIDLSLKL